MPRRSFSQPPPLEAFLGLRRLATDRHSSPVSRSLLARSETIPNDAPLNLRIAAAPDGDAPSRRSDEPADGCARLPRSPACARPATQRHFDPGTVQIVASSGETSPIDGQKVCRSDTHRELLEGLLHTLGLPVKDGGRRGDAEDGEGTSGEDCCS